MQAVSAEEHNELSIASPTHVLYAEVSAMISMPLDMLLTAHSGMNDDRTATPSKKRSDSDCMLYVYKQHASQCVSERRLGD